MKTIAKIAIDGSRLFCGKKTGVEDFGWQLVWAMVKNQDLLEKFEIVIYIKNWTKAAEKLKKNLPKKWQIKKTLNLRRGWSQLVLPYQAWKDQLDFLIIPSHSLPIWDWTRIFKFITGKQSINKYKRIYVLHGLERFEAGDAYGFWDNLLGKILLRTSYKQADQVLTFADVTKQKAEQLWGKAEKVKVIGQGAYGIKKILAAEKSKKIRKAVKVLAENKYFLYIGRKEQRKNLENLLKAYKIYKKSGKKVQLALVGLPGHGYDKLKLYLSINGVNEFGYVSLVEKHFLIANCSGLVMVSKAEGFGRPILEAIKADKPFLASDIPVLKEIYREAGLFVDPNNIKAIVKGLKNLEKQAEKGMEKNMKNTRQLLLRKYSWSEIIKQLQEILMLNEF
ncbi:MAG: glycosyltransferase [Candidatus Moranbacteria bacterium]|nr:glycosyltransferase [Candidatus Moranbacteria bacterium]